MVQSVFTQNGIRQVPASQPATTATPMPPHGFNAALALSRFGLGARADGFRVMGSDPRTALLAEIKAADTLPPALAALPATPQLLQEHFAYSKQREDQSARKPGAPAPMVQPGQSPARDIYDDELDARYNGAWRLAPIGFTERLAMFWSNHFAVTYNKNRFTAVSAGAFEREAIRPHIYGKFADMLLAAESHPCMLFYLDNFVSVGPNSPMGKEAGRGLNENLAREILELHTVGVGAGYTQSDVTSFAKVLTGWSFVHNDNPSESGRFRFNARAHEPGAQTVFGNTYANAGEAQGRAVLLTLARHPATARHIATKLARHFVADTPPPALVDRLAQAYTASDGDLAVVSKALIQSPEAWMPQRAKIRLPQEYVAAMMRLSGLYIPPGTVLQALNQLGETNWGSPMPNGYSDLTSVWATPVGIEARLGIASYVAAHVEQINDPRLLVEASFGPLLSDATRTAVGQAETRAQALTLIFMSPEFMRR